MPEVRTPAVKHSLSTTDARRATQLIQMAIDLARATPEWV